MICNFDIFFLTIIVDWISYFFIYLKLLIISDLYVCMCVYILIILADINVYRTSIDSFEQMSKRYRFWNLLLVILEWFKQAEKRKKNIKIIRLILRNNQRWQDPTREFLESMRFFLSFFFSYSLHGVAVHQRSSTSSTHDRDESRDFMAQVNYTKVGSVSSWYFLGNFIFSSLLSRNCRVKKCILHLGIYIYISKNWKILLISSKSFKILRSRCYIYIYMCLNIFNEVNIEIYHYFDKC